MYIQTTSYDYDAQVSETGRLTEKWRASKRVALWAKTWKHILLHGEHKRGLKGSDGLRVSETATKQNGGILFVDNPDKENAVTGHVAPYLPEVRLKPRELFPYVHDAPIGEPVEGGKYLASYVGLVKSDAPVLTAHIRPYPFEGARVYVYGEPGETKEVVLFHGSERGQSVMVTFSDAPLVYPLGPSQVVALPANLAGRTFFAENGDNAPVIIGPDDVREHGDDFATVEVAPGKTHSLFSLSTEGAITEINIVAPDLATPPVLSEWRSAFEPDYTAPDFDDSGWIEMKEPTSMIALGNGNNPYGWYRAGIESPVTASGTLHFAACTDRLVLYVNGVRVGASDIPPEDNHAGVPHTATFEIELTVGRNVLAVLADNLGLIKGDWQIGKGQEKEKKGIYGPVTLNVPGACWMIDVTKWRFQGTLYGEREGWMGKEGSSLTPEVEWQPLTSPDSAPIRWCRSTFTLDKPVDTATPLMIRLDGMGKGILWLNGRNLGRFWQPVGPQEVYYAPEPWLHIGENILVLAETEGNAPEHIRLEWDTRSAAAMQIAL
ncbi:MAG: beta galactosidase jelly roll domain-containing protein [Fibrella sp.]|nr:beta galactosidase jelly roll domain-containing protein [Armatimonadota bacterium]